MFMSGPVPKEAASFGRTICDELRNKVNLGVVPDSEGASFSQGRGRQVRDPVSKDRATQKVTTVEDNYVVIRMSVAI
jgi:hypothetical protein